MPLCVDEQPPLLEVDVGGLADNPKAEFLFFAPDAEGLGGATVVHSPVSATGPETDCSTEHESTPRRTRDSTLEGPSSPG
jgi:hypothetical protein